MKAQNPHITYYGKIPSRLYKMSVFFTPKYLTLYATTRYVVFEEEPTKLCGGGQCGDSFAEIKYHDSVVSIDLGANFGLKNLSFFCLGAM